MRQVILFLAAILPFGFRLQAYKSNIQERTYRCIALILSRETEHLQGIRQDKMAQVGR